MSVKESVLKSLKNNSGTYLSGEKLSDDLGVSRAAIWKAIKCLREEGYRIEAITNRGYILVDQRDGLSAEGIRACLPSRYKGNGIFVYDVTDSTNLRARHLTEAGGASPSAAAGGASPSGAAGELHGTIIAAEQQTAGRGRLGRGFFSPREGVYISVIIKPDFDMSKSTLVTVAAAAAVAEAVDFACGQKEETKIKWVNDVYLEEKKICGILTEGMTDFESGQIENLIVGIGVNTSLDGFPEELLATAGAVKGNWSRAELIAEIASRFLDYVGEIDERKFMETYRAKSMLIGKEILVYKGVYNRNPKEELRGVPARVTGIGDEGGLEIIHTDGSREVLTTGEVTVRPK